MARVAKTLTPQQMGEVETLAAVLTSEQIADYFGVGRQTFYDMMARDEEIAVRYKKGKARAIGAIAQGLITKARAGDTTSMIFFLKTQAGWRETAAVEHSLSDASTRVRADAAFAEFAALIDQVGRQKSAAPMISAAALPVDTDPAAHGAREGGGG
jgi:hypothetical protein